MTPADLTAAWALILLGTTGALLAAAICVAFWVCSSPVEDQP